MNAPIQHILLPTDLTVASEAAFAVALKMTLQTRGRLTVVHVSPTGDPNWSVLPTVRQMLTRWNVLSDWATVDEYNELGIRVQFHARSGGAVVREILEEADESGPFDLIVMASHHRDIVAQWLQPSVSEVVARQSGLPCLLVPERGQKRLVSPDGRPALLRALVPLGENPRDALMIDNAMRVSAALGAPRVRGTILHVGPKATIPDVDFTKKTAWAWDTEVRSSPNIATEILRVADEINADLITMATHGHDSPLDAITGSHAERVLHGALCPLLVVRIKD